MDVSQPLVVVAAFGAGPAFMFALRLVWTLVSSSIHLLFIAGSLFWLLHLGMPGDAGFSVHSIGEKLSGSIAWVQTHSQAAKDWADAYDVQVRIMPKETTKRVLQTSETDEQVEHGRY